MHGIRHELSSLAYTSMTGLSLYYSLGDFKCKVNYSTSAAQTIPNKILQDIIK